jgi:hypothetical protein
MKKFLADLRRFVSFALKLVIVASFYSCALHAQSSSTAELVGQVVDARGVGVANATVTLIDTERNNMHHAMTDRSGNYILPNLEVAPYRLEVTVTGFRKLVQRAIVLHVGDNREINVTLTAGQQTETVEVTEGANLVQTEQNSVSQIISRKTILEVPLNGRNPTQLVLISGASVVAPAGDLTGSKNWPTATTISIAGGTASGTNYVLDGGTNLDTFTNVNLPIPFPDALQEFGVATSVLPARIGYSSGGLVTVVTKSGSNQFHGSAFEFVRNGIFNAQNRFSTVPDALKRNQFGGTIGGHVLRDKLFFFGGYQDTRTVSQPGSTFAFVPTTAQIAGDFTVAESAACQSTGRPHAALVGYPTNIIPATTFDPAAVKLLQYIPKTSDPCGKLQYGVKAVQYESQSIGRVDWNHNARHTLYGRYFLAGYNAPAPFSATNYLVAATPGLNIEVNAFTLGDYITFRPNLLNAFHGTITRRGHLRALSTEVANPLTLGINIYAPVPHDLHVAVTNGFSIGCGTCALARYGITTWELADDVDYIKGRHHFGIGANLLRTDNNYSVSFDANGIFAFSGATTGDAMADFLLGSLSSFSQTTAITQAPRALVVAPYVQDTIRLTNRVLVTMGLRWEPHALAHDYRYEGSNFSRANFNANIHSAIYPGAPAGAVYAGDAGVPKNLAPTEWNNLSPRIGVVLDPTGKGRETLRAGFAIMYDHQSMFTTQRLQYNPPYIHQVDLGVSAKGGFSNPWTTGYAYAGGNPFPVTAVSFPAPSAWVVLPDHLRTTAMNQWNLTYQRQVGADWVFEASYIGSKTNHIWGGVELNPAIYSAAVCAQFTTGCTTANTTQRRVLNQANAVQGKYYGNLTLISDGASASYNGLLVSANHRLTKGISVLANYTWSHCIGQIETPGDVAGNAFSNPSDIRADTSSCGYDLRHILNASVVQTFGMSGHGFVAKAIGQWQFAPLLRITSGIPLNVTTGSDNARTGVGLDRPNLNGTVSPYANTGNKLQYLNAAAFTANAIGTLGTLSRNALRGPGAYNFDLGIARLFTIKRVDAQFRCDTFNVFNKVNLIAPATGTGIPGISAAGISTSLASATFGTITSSGDPRIIQLAMKVAF